MELLFHSFISILLWQVITGQLTGHSRNSSSSILSITKRSCILCYPMRIINVSVHYCTCTHWQCYHSTALTLS